MQRVHRMFSAFKRELLEHQRLLTQQKILKLSFFTQNHHIQLEMFRQ